MWRRSMYLFPLNQNSYIFHRSANFNSGQHLPFIKLVTNKLLSYHICYTNPKYPHHDPNSPLTSPIPTLPMIDMSIINFKIRLPNWKNINLSPELQCQRFMGKPKRLTNQILPSQYDIFSRKKNCTQDTENISDRKWSGQIVIIIVNIMQKTL